MKVTEVNILSKQITLSGSEGRVANLPQAALFFNDHANRWEVKREYVTEFLSN
jgi:hypothetical protein